MAMGAADAVPGVSGGTVAFISGVYEQLIESVRSINPGLLLTWRKEGFKAVWQKIDGNFLLTLLAGIISSILLLAHVISYLLEAQPVLLSAFFFGLVSASVLAIYGEITDRSWKTTVALLAGVILMLLVNQLLPTLDTSNPLHIFMAGSIAICAMILPGISGSFLLLIMGVYGDVMHAVKSFELMTMLWFVSGCAAGILGFSQILSWLLHRFHQTTLALLTGVLIGSLSQIWPWRQVVSYKIDSHGRAAPITHDNLLPSVYEQLTGMSSQMVPALILMILGFALVWFFYRQADK
ncbi:hypothetical protein BTA35_0203790 [Oceanospirillum linum]|uniref:DUF368 domain-containing protein n=2 Tax=Oceanospirillum linum TaxID=966 RepID=A0A1T1HGH4_OCELI|nr:hypothetical protein BTA35_0203790 [Oceanospirillum linum]